MALRTCTFKTPEGKSGRYFLLKNVKLYVVILNMIRLRGWAEPRPNETFNIYYVDFFCLSLMSKATAGCQNNSAWKEETGCAAASEYVACHRVLWEGMVLWSGWRHRMERKLVSQLIKTQPNPETWMIHTRLNCWSVQSAKFCQNYFCLLACLQPSNHKFLDKSFGFVLYQLLTSTGTGSWLPFGVARSEVKVTKRSHISETNGHREVICYLLFVCLFVCLFAG